MIQRDDEGGIQLRTKTAPWIIPFTCDYFEACGRMNFVPDEQAMRVMAALATLVEIPL